MYVCVQVEICKFIAACVYVRLVLNLQACCVYVCTYQLIYSPVCLCSYLTYLPTYLPVYLSIYNLSIYLSSTYLPSYLSIYLSSQPSIYLSMHTRLRMCIDMYI